MCTSAGSVWGSVSVDEDSGTAGRFSGSDGGEVTTTGETTAAPASGGGSGPTPPPDTAHDPLHRSDPADEHTDPTGTGSEGSVSHRWRSLLLGSAAYLLLSLFIWMHAWQHPTSVTTCGCGDTSLFTWFLEWPAFAISHGLDPLYSSAMNFPVGVNLLSNTSEIGIGIVLAPVTWLFGPVASLNVALTLAPVLSAISMCVLLRRWVSWSPAAFVGGLLYGFCPFILVSLSDAHLMLGMAFVPPLMVLCLDELLIRQQWRPMRTGLLLALLTAVQFFIGTEVLVITFLVVAIGILLLVVYAALRRPALLRSHARYAITGFAVWIAVAVAVLAIPTWYALTGPAAFGKTVWPGILGGINRKQRADPSLFVSQKSWLLSAVATIHDNQFGGYQGLVLSNQYFGVPIIVVLGAGVALWRRDRRLWFFGASGLLAVLLSLGSRTPIWRGLQHFSLLENIVPVRFVLIAYLCAAIMLGLILDHTYAYVRGRTRTSARSGLIGAGAALLVAVIALVQPATYLRQTIPMTTRSIDVPTWFTSVAPHLRPHQVVLVFPATFTSYDNAMTWQAAEGMTYSMVGEGGPGGVLIESGHEKPGATVIARMSNPQIGAGPLNRLQVAAVRKALRGWKVTMVVIPDQPGLPAYDQTRSVTAASTLITAATGMLPTHQASAWVWRDVNGSRPGPIPSNDDLNRCTEGLGNRGTVAVRRATTCVLASSRRAR